MIDPVTVALVELRRKEGPLGPLYRESRNAFHFRRPVWVVGPREWNEFRAWYYAHQSGYSTFLLDSFLLDASSPAYMMGAPVQIRPGGGQLHLEEGCQREECSVTSLCACPRCL